MFEAAHTVSYSAGSSQELESFQSSNQPAEPCSPVMLYKIECLEKSHKCRKAVEQAIGKKYAEVHGADLKQFLPVLLSLSHGSRIDAAAGLQFAGESPLFLEQYLEQPIEALLADHLGEAVERRDIVELGNFAVLEKDSISVFLTLLFNVLSQSGTRYLTLTATPTIKRLAKRFGFKLYTLAEARKEKLQNDSQQWGQYYECRPEVMFGDLDTVAKLVALSPAITQLRNHFQYRISNVAGQIKALIQDADSKATTKPTMQ